jgi:uncharacterized protein
MNKDLIYKKVINFLKKHDARKIAIFGSFVKNTEKSDSDIDIIVEFSEKKSLLDLVGIEQELTENIGIKVDLLTEKAISPYLIKSIKKEMMVIYG